LLAFTAHRDPTAGHLDVEVVVLDAGQLDLDEVGGSTHRMQPVINMEERPIPQPRTVGAPSRMELVLTDAQAEDMLHLLDIFRNEPERPPAPVAEARRKWSWFKKRR
jgi:hypothetical protein